MATADCTSAITKKEYFWGDLFEGSPEALVAAGLVRADQLPGQPGRGKFSQSYYDGEPVPPIARPPKDARYLNVRRKSARRFQVTQHVSEDVQSVRAAQIKADRIIRTMPKTEEEYRERSIDALLLAIVRPRVRFEKTALDGFSYDRDSLEALDELVLQMLAILRDGRVHSDPGARAAVVTKACADVAQADTKLQEFLAGAMTQACIQRLV